MARSNTKTVATNFRWYAIEIGVSLLTALLTTIALARVLGPVLLGHFNYVYWITKVGGHAGSLGVPMALFKYMGEYLGSGEKHIARAVFQRCWKIQIGIAIVIALAGVGVVLVMGDPAFRVMSVLLVVAIVPQMLTFIPSQANAASEKFSANTRGSLIGVAANGVGLALALGFGWGVIGVAAAILVSQIIELFAKLLPVLRWTRQLPEGTLPPHFMRRLASYAGRGTGMFLLQIVVWDRSDVVLLRMLNSDIRQLAYFSVAFSLVERLLMLPQAFGTAVAATQMVEYGRDKLRMFRMTGTAGTYALLVACPMLLGAACLSGPIVGFMYGSKYLAVIPVFSLAAIFAIGKAVLAPAQNLLYSTEEIGFLLWWNGLCGVVDIGIDVLLVPRYGAMGAAIGNGTAQMLAAIGIWAYALRRHPLGLQSRVLAKIIASSAIMTGLVFAVGTSSMPAAAKLIVGPTLGAVALLTSLRLLAVFSADDRHRLISAGHSLPGRVRHLVEWAVAYVAPLPARAEYPATTP